MPKSPVMSPTVGAMNTEPLKYQVDMCTASETRMDYSTAAKVSAVATTPAPMTSRQPKSFCYVHFVLLEDCDIRLQVCEYLFVLHCMIFSGQLTRV